MPIERLLALIDEFQMRVREAVELFRLHRGIHPTDWRSAGLNGIGFIDEAKTMKYAFHGIGVYVELPSGPVDWDFGFGGRDDGFDKWRLGQFAEEGSPNFPEFAHTDLLDETFAAAVRQGIFQQLFRHRQDNLYYFPVEGVH